MVDTSIEALRAISPIDGRYRGQSEVLSRYFSEYALMRYRLLVEVEYFIALANHSGVGFVRSLTPEEQDLLRGQYREFSLEGAARIKEIEGRIKHDTKAVEYYLRECLAGTSLDDLREGIHFGLTSEDVTNLAYAIALRDGLTEGYFPVLEKLQTRLEWSAREWAAVPMLARTHGQPASPTTMGKELAVFAGRIRGQRALLDDLWRKIPGKLNGATGCFNAHKAACPQVDWIAFSREFVQSLGLTPNPLTTQIEPHDMFIAVFDAITRINVILIDFVQDVWHYVSYGYFVQTVEAGEVGSSTMPHKVNPIQFENAEGNLEVANSLFDLLARKLPVSRMQRDLSGSTVMRNIGVALAHTVIALRSVSRGLERLQIDEQLLREELRNHWEVVTEGIQTILRREGVGDAYDLLKTFSRGAAIGHPEIVQFVEQLDVSPEVKAELLALTPETYIGEAARLATLTE